MNKPFIAAALCFIVLNSLAGCAGSPPTLSAADAGSTAYQLNAGDKVRITSFNDPSLSGEFSVTGEGNLSLPLIGNLPVRGETIEAVQAAIRTRLANGYVNDPRITLEVIAFRPYFVLGEVTRPGEYAFSNGLTVMQAAAVAGGFTPRANRRHIFIQRANDPVERKVDTRTMTAYVKPGDTIRVGERYF